MEKNIYEQCPIFKSKNITLRLVDIKDAKELINCYSDIKAVPLFNSDNCDGDDFHYKTLEKMKEAIRFWEYSYENRYFVRFTVIINSNGEKAGTVEMFKRAADDEFDGYGVLRIDLCSKFEKQEYISEILDIVKNNFYKAFEVNNIITKAVSIADVRVNELKRNGYYPMNNKFIIYDDYYIRKED